MVQERFKGFHGSCKGPGALYGISTASLKHTGAFIGVSEHYMNLLCRFKDVYGTKGFQRFSEVFREGSRALWAYQKRLKRVLGGCRRLNSFQSMCLMQAAAAGHM